MKNGKVISFWSPVHGQGKITTNACLISTYLSLIEDEKQVLSMDSQFIYSRMQELLKEDAEDGTSQIYTFVHSRNLDSEKLRIFTSGVIENRLYLLGSTKQSLVGEKVTEHLKDIIKCARESYDYVIIDTNSGTFNKNTKKVLENSDLVIVNLPQEGHILDKFFGGKERFYHEALDKTKYICVIGNYHPYKHFNLKKIKRWYGIKEIYKIPNNEELHKSISDQRLVEWMISNYNIDKKDDNREFINSISEIVDRIRESDNKRRSGFSFL
ncbi:AAA family ATPase [Sporosalibacterium faouarense]|uniref:AAA family ATPase n=1 Tax=Sporosalibacterium faouarense TaxID=516123 RepID=UPI00192C2C15|nr:AAA family ATPase [Sporosalibacterium faouarense]